MENSSNSRSPAANDAGRADSDAPAPLTPNPSSGFLLDHPKLVLSPATRARLQAQAAAKPPGAEFSGADFARSDETPPHLLFELGTEPAQQEDWAALCAAFPVQRVEFPGGPSLCRVPWKPALLARLLALPEITVVREETVRHLILPRRS